MKINGAYKFRTKANVFPSLKICFLGQYQDRVSGDTNFSFFIATPGNEVEEVVIENPYSGDFFVPKVEEVYLQNVGNKKTDWVATFKCTWDTSLNAQEGELKVLLGYKAGETVIDEKPKEYIAVETDPKYLVNTIAQRKHGALHPAGGGFFTGSYPVTWNRYEITATSESGDNEVVATGSKSFSSSGPNTNKTDSWQSNSNNTGQSNYFYYYDTNGLEEELIKPTYSQSANLLDIRSGISVFGLPGTNTRNYSISCSNIVFLGSSPNISAPGTYLVPGYVPIPNYLNEGDANYIYYSGPNSNLYRENGFIKRKSWISPSVSFFSDITASHSLDGSFFTQPNDLESWTGSENSSASWNVKCYSTFLTRNLTDSFIFKSEETATHDGIFSYSVDDDNNPVLAASFAFIRNCKTSVSLTSLSSGEERALCEINTTKELRENGFQAIRDVWGRYNAKPYYAWDYYSGSYGVGYSHQSVGNYHNEPIVIEDETPINIFMKAVSHRGKSVLRGDYLYYIESDVVGFGNHIPYVESDAFTPNINGFLTKEFTLSVLVFNIKDIENYEKKEVKFKPAKLPEGMENLTISKILAIQYIE